ncbi:MAG: CpXC domain-containing protein [Candidatus Heimdallarchaeota archaeon]
MTTMRYVKVACTNCEKMFEITWSPSVNTWLDPDIIERIIEDDYYFVCPHCEERHFLSAQMLISCPKGMFYLNLGDDYETKMEKLQEYGVIDITRKVIKLTSTDKPQREHESEISEMVGKIDEIVKDFKDNVLDKKDKKEK